MQKYRINPSQCIGIYYRGTDKKSETQLASFETFFSKIKQVSNENPNMKMSCKNSRKSNKLFRQGNSQ
jgi:hypothetical protein